MTLRAAVFKASRLVIVSIVAFLPVANISNRGMPPLRQLRNSRREEQRTAPVETGLHWRVYAATSAFGARAHSIAFQLVLVRPHEAAVETPVGVVEHVGMKANFHESLQSFRSYHLGLLKLRLET
jgi:hypothetical protein